MHVTSALFQLMTYHKGGIRVISAQQLSSHGASFACNPSTESLGESPKSSNTTGRELVASFPWWNCSLRQTETATDNAVWQHIGKHATRGLVVGRDSATGTNVTRNIWVLFGTRKWVCQACSVLTLTSLSKYWWITYYEITVLDKSIRRLETPSCFLAISPKQMHISTQNFEHLLSHQLHTLCKKLKAQGVTGRPQLTLKLTRPKAPIINQQVGHK